MDDEPWTMDDKGERRVCDWLEVIEVGKDLLVYMVVLLVQLRILI